MKRSPFALLGSSLLLTAMLAGCGGGNSDNAGFAATDATRVGDGLPSSAHQRSMLAFGGPDGCTNGTTVTLVPVPGGVAQAVCGLASADAAGNPQSAMDSDTFKVK